MTEVRVPVDPPEDFPVFDHTFWATPVDSWVSSYDLIDRETNLSIGRIERSSTRLFRYGWSVQAENHPELVGFNSSAVGAAHRLVHILGLADSSAHDCRYCGENRFDVQLLQARSGRAGYVCTECFRNRGFASCSLCDHISDNVHSTVSNGQVCLHCVMNRTRGVEMVFERCTMCTVFHRADEGQCCVHRDSCRDCGSNRNDVTEFTFARGEGEGYLCDRCTRSYRDCADCGYMSYTSSLVQLRDDSSWYCTSCVDTRSLSRCVCGIYYDEDAGSACCERSGYDLIKSYSYKPRLKFRGEGKTFFGIEVEIKVTDLTRQANLADKGFGNLACLKHDGSVDNGFEIVTQPMSYDWAMSDFPWQTFTDLAKSGAYADDQTGIHVHVSKAGFANPAHDHRWYLFIHRNADQVQTLARRVSKQWAAFRPEDRAAAKRIAKKEHSGHGRYAAINVENVATYEMRVFASSLDIQQIQAAMGLVSASVEYTRKLSAQQIIRHNGWAWSAFAEWVSGREEYAPLYAEMTRLNISA